MKIIRNIKNPVTQKQRDVLNYIVKFHSEFEQYPTEQEIADALGTTRTAIAERLILLKNKGYIARAKGHRNIVLLQL